VKPSVGRIVHYVSYGTPGGEYGSQCRAAVVTEVPEIVDRTANDKGHVVSLCVLNPEGMFFNREVWHSDAAAGGTWHWPEREQ
jgi:hypothetical protein